MFDFMPNKIDFSDEKQYNHLQKQINLTLQKVLNCEKNTLDQLENILFMIQSCIQPFICQILNFESLNTYSKLKNAFEYVRKNWQTSVNRPYSQLEMYCEMCNQIACIVDSHDDPEYLASIHLSQESVERLSEGYYSELKNKDIISRTVAFYSYSIFESYYYFLDYFSGTKERTHAIESCLFQIDNILFHILWQLDCSLENYKETSYFFNAVNELSNFNLLL